jgi:hypothetical protein
MTLQNQNGIKSLVFIKVVPQKKEFLEFLAFPERQSFVQFKIFVTVKALKLNHEPAAQNF